MPKRLLILSVSAGAGHLRAAQAIELAARELAPDAIIKNIDVLTLTNAAFRRLYGRAYLNLVNKAPHALGYFYDLLDRPRSARHKSDRLRLAVERLNLRPLVSFLESEPFDLIVNTHFLPTEIIALLRRKRRLATPQFTVTTDFETHRLWIHAPCDHYFAATQESAVNLQHWGVPTGDIMVSGIPIHPEFSKAKDRAACLARQGVRGETPVVLLLAGGFGVGPIDRIYEAILSLEQPLELIVVCGRNEALKKRIEAASRPRRHRARILGFTDQMDELMVVADVVVSKPGGLTSSEVLARGAALAIVNPIPGQESRNSDYLLENGAAIKINNIATLAYKLGELLRDAPRLKAIRARARELGRPRAAYTVAAQALAWPTS